MIARITALTALLAACEPGPVAAPASITQNALAGTFTIDLYVVNDHARFEQQGANTEASTAAIVTAAANILQHGGLSSDVRLVLVGQRTYKTVNPFSPASANATDTLQAFETWVDTTPDLNNHDLVYFFGSEGANQSSTHAAWVSGACSGTRTGFIRTSNNDEAFLATLLAHSIGHSLGMVHDGQGNACDPSANIMAAFFNPADLKTTFSSCSDAAATAFLGGGQAACLTNVPANVYGTFCGDGTASASEQCDCGAADCTGLDPCCNGATCHFGAGVTCSAFDPCCTSSCVFASTTTVCRAGNACTAQTNCSGTSALCPAPVHSPSGTACIVNGNDGACHLGVCGSQASACAALGADPIPPLGALSSCTSQPFDCAGMTCAPLDRPSQCVAVVGHAAPDGVPCGKGMQCLAGACVASSTIGPDSCANDATKTNAGYCGCGVPDTDRDADGTADCLDACPDDPAHIAPPCDTCLDDPDKLDPGQCGCGVPDTDTDGDGVADCVDGCPTDKTVSDGACPKKKRGCDAAGGGWLQALAVFAVLTSRRRSQSPTHGAG